MQLRKRYVFMDESGSAAGGASGAVGGAAGGAAASGVGTAATGVAGNGGAAAGSGGAAAAGASAAGGLAAAGGSALAAGAEATVAAGTDWVPEKYRVAKADGSIDVEASARKLAEGHGQLEKRLGSGDAPPKTADEYAVVVPEALKEAVGDLSKDEMFTQFRTDMHGLGLNQKQFDGVMARYFELAPKLAGGAAQLNTEIATADLRKTWADESTFKQNVKLAYTAGDAIAKAAGMSFDDLEKAGLANNPTFIKLMAAIGPEFGEDSSVGGASVAGMASEDEMKAILASDANLDKKHPQHKATRARVDAYYNRKYGTAPIS